MDALDNFLAEDDDDIDFSSSSNNQPEIENHKPLSIDEKLSNNTRENLKNYSGSEVELVGYNYDKNGNLVNSDDYVDAANVVKSEEQEYFRNITKNIKDPVMAQAVKTISDKLGRSLNADEYDKLCRTYAADLTNADAAYRGRDPNPVDYKLYYQALKNNEKIEPAFVMHAKNSEKSIVDEIDGLLKQASYSNNNRDLNVNIGTSVNIRHKGKIHYRDEEHNREITIDNGKDVKLLRMKYRKDYLDKKFKDDIEKRINEDPNEEAKKDKNDEWS